MVLTFFYFLIVFTATLLGGLLPLQFEIIRKKPSLALHFSAGILVGVAILHLLPETFRVLGNRATAPFLFGFLILFVLEKFILVHPCEEDEECAVHRLGKWAFIGISFHALIDGIALGTGAFVPDLGMMVLLGLIFHKIPAAMSLAIILMTSHFSRKKTVILIILFSLATPLGGIFSLYGLNHFSQDFLGWALGISAGTFLAIASGDLLMPMHTHDERPVVTIFSFLLGLSIAFLGWFIAPH